ncbi:MAG: RluA family pseudouridine synthase [Patescibacteria group bacterium]|nr:RluA family pseudouridine synthase [Patescibacteria group bacterium]
MSQIKVIYEDSDLLVLDKPAGITVNRSDTTREEETVQDWVDAKFPIFPGLAKRSGAGNFQFSKDKDSDFYKRSGIVHRLDKETSGILLVAKTPEAFESLQKQFKERVIKKTYLALVHGKVAPETGEISVPVGRLPWDRKKFGVLAGGREAVTRYRVISNFQFPISNKKEEQMSLLELYPETGRTHQIRVHLKYFNHPIFADFLYAGRKISRDDRKILGRVFLHAHKIAFTHPVSCKHIVLESPLPEELKKIINQ